MVFGEQNSRMKFESTTIELNYSILRPTWTVPNLIQHRSILTGRRTIRQISSDRARFQVVMNIYRQGSPHDKMDEVLGYNHSTVKFAPHKDEPYMIDEFGDEADFYIISMIPYYVRNEAPDFRDKLQITFESLGALGIAAGLVGYLIDGDGDYFIDSSGNRMRIKTTGADRI